MYAIASTPLELSQADEAFLAAIAKAQGVSPDTVQRIWSGHGLKPHLVKTFKLSHDPRFEEKLTDVSWASI